MMNYLNFYETSIFNVLEFDFLLVVSKLNCQYFCIDILSATDEIFGFTMDLRRFLHFSNCNRFRGFVIFSSQSRLKIKKC